MAVAASRGVVLVLTEDGHILAFGNNERGQLGVGDFNVHDELCLLNYVDSFGGREVVMVAAGHSFSACITNDGSLWNWGTDLAYIQDSGMERHKCRPVKMCQSLHGNSPVIMVACGWEFMLILTASGRIWAIGNGSEYQLGTGRVETCKVPTCIDPAYFDGDEIGMVSAAGTHCMAVSKTGGRLWIWGCNDYGQCGVSEDGDVEIPTLIPAASLGGEEVAFVCCGYDFSMIVTSEGVVWACGNNKTNETGCLVTFSCLRTRVFERVGGAEYFGPGGARMVSCGLTHSIILAKNNSVWCCGSNNEGQLGRQREVDGRPGLVDSECFNNGNSDVLSDNDVQVVEAGGDFSIALTSGGVVYTWGIFNKSVSSLAEGALGLAANTTDHARAGRWHKENRARTVAFAMGAHVGLANNADNGGTTAYSANFPEELLRELFQRMRCALREGSSDGVLMLLGMGPE